MNVKDKLGLLGATILTIGMGAVTPALAQDAPAASEEDVIVVTGSRLRRETFESPNPTFQVGSQQMDAAQTVNTIDALEDIPLLGVGVNNRGTQGQNGDSFAFPDVLDLGTQRTLTLLNGRRVVPGNQGTVFVPGNSSGAQVDLSMINPQIIDRVEVLAGTGGAIYGADAVAGVVNVITKDDYEGLDIRGQYSHPEIGEGDSYRLSGLWGANFMDGRANITVSAEYFNQESIFSDIDLGGALYVGPALPTNSLNTGTRRTGTLSVSSQIAAFGTCATAATCTTAFATSTPFLPAASNNVATNYLGRFGDLPLNNTHISLGGTVLTNQNFSGVNAATFLVPAQAVGTAAARSGIVTPLDPLGFASFAPTALTAGQDTAGGRLAIFNSFNTGADAATNLANYNLLSAAAQSQLVLSLLQRNRQTPYEYLAANPGIDPMLFIGSFGTAHAAGGVNPASANGYLPTITNTDIATSALFPRRAVPLSFAANGQLQPYNVGIIAPPLQSQIAATFGGGGYEPSANGFTQIQAGTERASLAITGHYDITDWLRTRTEILYTDITFDQVQGPSTNAGGGNAQAGTLAVPIFFRQNPFFNVGTNIAQIDALIAQGLTLPAAYDPDGPFGAGGAQDVLYIGRALSDIVGGEGLRSTQDTSTFRIAQSLEGDFSLFDRDFYWDVAAIYGTSETDNNRTDIGDIEFALATDVITGPGGQPVCRQQTLAQPIPIEYANPGASSILNAGRTVAGLIPTADQVARCVPLNIMGEGASSQAARDYVQVDSSTHALNRQIVYTGSLGGEIIRLPAGAASLGLNIEYRRETAEFEPNNRLARGDGRTALQGRGAGELEFLEYGYEVLIPIFGEGFQFPLMNSLEFSYAFRMVEREQDSSTALVTGDGTVDDTFNYSVTWKPFEDLTVRGARGRTVRSASLVELLGPFTIAFTTPDTTYHPCTTENIGLGSASRQANCLSAVQALGIAPDAASAQAFLNTFNNAATVGNIARSAVAAGNPNLANEEGNSYTYGITYEPSWAPRLVLAADFFSVDLTNEILLFGPFANNNSGSSAAFMGICFDSATYPNAPIGGLNACDQQLFPQATAGGFIIPAVNAITGNPSFAGVLAGTPSLAPGLAPATNSFIATMAQFNNINAGGRAFRGVNLEARYNFGLGEVPVLGGFMENWGDIFLRTTLFHNQRYDLYADNAFTQRFDRQVGEHPGTGQPEYEFRMDIRHRIGPFDHTLQWNWNPMTVSDITVAKPLYNEQSLAFRGEDFNFFNYNASYDITDSMTVRLVVNNVTDEDWNRGIYGVGNQFDAGIGREWVVGFQARF
ncbi:tonB-dependent receptor [alpha proteobacterium U9-1i]|nr:tonB-dependent receptor [alpha proteobacterium U9-1i]